MKIQNFGNNTIRNKNISCQIEDETQLNNYIMTKVRVLVACREIIRLESSFCSSSDNTGNKREREVLSSFNTWKCV